MATRPYLCGKNHYVWAGNLAMLLFCLMALTTAGQVRGTTISGSITSPSGGPIANATITLKNLATNEARSFTANADGSYEVKNLAPGRYEITTSAPGYATGAITVDLAADSGALANVVLVPLASGGA